MTGKTILLDVGEKSEIEKKEVWQEKVTTSTAKRSLIPYLKSRGVAKIDQLVLTTSEPQQLDHVLEISKVFELGEVLVTDETLSKQEMMDELKQSKVNVRAVQRGEKLFVFGSSLEVIATQNRDKNDSIAMYGKLLNQTFLVTGNMEENSLTSYDPKFQADVLITHQPSSKKKTDVEVFKTLQPKITVMSVDKKKRFKVKMGRITKNLGIRFTKRIKRGPFVLKVGVLGK
ncbi:hypothetical protein HMPREF1124_1473 [Streptococcus infantis X]|uniref:Uncharacterized protein n=1 Tax=Streptococcus infantis X TaxID=997830 RepID=F9PED4_9STRE|nr:hypothetical protein HMPREF1124_1473 [Streptococcus infantis X]